MDTKRDMWAEWLLNRRFGGDRQRMRIVLQELLYPVREKVLSHADLRNNDTLLDVGCGEGFFTSLLAENGNRVVGLDIVDEPLFGSRMVDYVQADLSNVFPAAAEGAGEEDGWILDVDLDKPADSAPVQ